MSAPISISLPHLLHFVISNFTATCPSREPPTKPRNSHRGFVGGRVLQVQIRFAENRARLEEPEAGNTTGKSVRRDARGR